MSVLTNRLRLRVHRAEPLYLLCSLSVLSFEHCWANQTWMLPLICFACIPCVLILRIQRVHRSIIMIVCITTVDCTGASRRYKAPLSVLPLSSSQPRCRAPPSACRRRCVSASLHCRIPPAAFCRDDALQCVIITSQEIDAIWLIYPGLCFSPKSISSGATAKFFGCG